MIICGQNLPDQPVPAVRPQNQQFQLVSPEKTVDADWLLPLPNAGYLWPKRLLHTAGTSTTYATPPEPTKLGACAVGTRMG